MASGRELGEAQGEAGHRIYATEYNHPSLPISTMGIPKPVSGSPRLLIKSGVAAPWAGFNRQLTAGPASARRYKALKTWPGRVESPIFAGFWKGSRRCHPASVMKSVVPASTPNARPNSCSQTDALGTWLQPHPPP
jgi:hypothetical protein